MFGSGLKRKQARWVVAELGSHAVRGVLTEVYSDSLVLMKASVLAEGGDVEIGEAVIPKEKVLYLYTNSAVVPS